MKRKGGEEKRRVDEEGGARERGGENTQVRERGDSVCHPKRCLPWVMCPFLLQISY